MLHLGLFVFSFIIISVALMNNLDSERLGTEVLDITCLSEL